MERELQLLNEDFEYAKIKLKSCQQFTEQLERKHNLKVRNCFGEIERLQHQLDAETAAHKQLEEENQKLSAAAHSSGERLAYLEQEMVKLQAACAQRTANHEALTVELRSCQRRINWAWLLVLSLLDKAFPWSDTVETQTDLVTPTAEVGTLVDLPPQVADFDSFWCKVRAAGERLHVLGVSGENRWSLLVLIDFITTTYSRKLAVDMGDDMEHKERQSLPEFLHLFYLEETGSKAGAFRALCGLVANTLDHVKSLHGGIMSTTVTTTARGAVRRDVRRRSSVDLANPELRHEILTQQSVVTRVDMFARLLHLDSPAADRGVPVQYTSLYLRLLLYSRRGEYPLLPPVLQKMIVPTSLVTSAMEQVLRNMKSHERLALMHQFEDEVSQKRDAVDLDLALMWICDQWRIAVLDRTEERLAALFAAADADGNGELDFEEFRELVRRMAKEKTRAVSARQMLRMYSHMALAPRVDSAAFVSHARVYGLGAFVLGVDDDPCAAGTDARHILDKVGTDLSRIQGVITELIQDKPDKAVGIRAAQNLQILKSLLREGIEPMYAAHILALTLMECRDQAPHPPVDVDPASRRPMLMRSRSSRSPPRASVSQLESARSKSPQASPAADGRREKTPAATTSHAALVANDIAKHYTISSAAPKGDHTTDMSQGPQVMRRVVVQVPSGK